MTDAEPLKRISTGVKNLDQILGGGLPDGSITVFGGSPGAGKTTLAQQICFYNASAEKPVLFFQTLSEPTAKTLKHLGQFDFFDYEKIGKSVHFFDLGGVLRSKGLEQATILLMEQMKKIKPAMVVVDSFKAFEDLSENREELRKFGYQVAVNLMAWQCTGFLLGEYSQHNLQNNPISSIVDGILHLTTCERSGEHQRVIQVTKMRGTEHSLEGYPFSMSSAGLEIYAPRMTIRGESADANSERLKTGISALDKKLGEGIPSGSSVLLSGPTGSGKTILSIESIYRSAKDLGEKAILFTFEESKERILSAAQGLGFDLASEIKRGLIEIISVPQPDLLMEKHLLMIQENVRRFQPKHIVVDSLSIFLSKATEPAVMREKVYQLAMIVQKSGAIGIFTTETQFGGTQISRSNVEESIVDGIILLTAPLKERERQRYLEIYKLRNTAHASGINQFQITAGGIQFKDEL